MRGFVGLWCLAFALVGTGSAAAAPSKGELGQPVPAGPGQLVPVQPGQLVPVQSGNVIPPGALAPQRIQAPTSVEDRFVSHEPFGETWTPATGTQVRVTFRPPPGPPPSGPNAHPVWRTTVVAVPPGSQPTNQIQMTPNLAIDAAFELTLTTPVAGGGTRTVVLQATSTDTTGFIEAPNPGYYRRGIQAQFDVERGPAWTYSLKTRLRWLDPQAHPTVVPPLASAPLTMPLSTAKDVTFADAFTAEEIAQEREHRGLPGARLFPVKVRRTSPAPIPCAFPSTTPAPDYIPRECADYEITWSFTHPQTTSVRDFRVTTPGVATLSGKSPANDPTICAPHLARALAGRVCDAPVYPATKGCSYGMDQACSAYLSCPFDTSHWRLDWNGNPPADFGPAACPHRGSPRTHPMSRTTHFIYLAELPPGTALPIAAGTYLHDNFAQELTTTGSIR